jgi:DNA-binding response OmpR family regulator
MRLLLIEDSERLRTSLTSGFRREGFAVDSAGDGKVGFWFATTHTYDVIVLDLMLPGMDGLSLLLELRASGKPQADAQVLVLTARDSVDDRVLGLRSGADDYLVKPFSFDELLARVHALARRGHGVKSTQLKFGDLLLDTDARTLSREGHPIELSARDYALLHYLAMRHGQVVTRAQIEEQLYDDRAQVMSNVVEASIYALRKKIDRPDHPSMIQTRRGMGYVFCVDIASSRGRSQGTPTGG